MNAIGMLDLLSLLATLIALVFLGRGWKRPFRRDAKGLLLVIVALNLFHNFSNALEWFEISNAFDALEDYIEVLVPALWGSFFYALLREGVERDLRESESRFRSLFEQLPDGVVLIDPHDPKVSWPVVDCNEAFCRMNGYTRDELIGQTIDIVHGRTEDATERTAYWEQLRHGSTIVAEALHRRKDGTIFPIRSSTGLIALHRKQLLLGVDRDITKQRQAEAEREVLIAELEAKNAELERFTYTVSHDLKSPLITIQGFLGFLEQDAIAGNIDQMKADITRISNAAQTMQQLLDELLELSRIGRIINPPEDVPFGELAREALDSVAGRLAERDIEVEIAPELLRPDGPRIYGDRARLREVMENLIDNAVKFMGEQPEPRVQIGMRLDAKETAFFVRDNGMGIEPHYQEKIFGLFEKLDARTEGSGVGLAIVHRIVEVHGGRIWVESEGLKKGTTFLFTLPSSETSSNKEH